MRTDHQLDFTAPDLLQHLPELPAERLDSLPFGVIGFGQDAEARVLVYSAFESFSAGLDPERVLGLPLFATVAQCMNNFMVAQRFEDAQAARLALDATLPFVLTLRMKPTPVRLRLLSTPIQPMRFVLIDRRAAGGRD